MTSGGLTGLQERQPDLVGLLRWNEDLETVLAGVTGPRHCGAHIGHFAVTEPVVLHAGEIDAGERLKDVQRLRPLQRNERITRAGVHDHGIADALDLFGHPGVVLRDVAGVDHEQEVRGGEAIHQQVVHERALRREQAGILRLPDRELRRVVGRDALDGGECVLAGDFHLAHVADIEDAGTGADGVVLCREPAVFDGHVPAAEGHHLRTGCTMTGVQWCFLERSVGGLIHGEFERDGNR